MSSLLPVCCHCGRDAVGMAWLLSRWDQTDAGPGLACCYAGRAPDEPERIRARPFHAIDRGARKGEGAAQ